MRLWGLTEEDELRVRQIIAAEQEARRRHDTRAAEMLVTALRCFDYDGLSDSIRQSADEMARLSDWLRRQTPWWWRAWEWALDLPHRAKRLWCTKVAYPLVIRRRLEKMDSELSSSRAAHEAQDRLNARTRAIRAIIAEREGRATDKEVTT